MGWERPDMEWTVPGLRGMRRYEHDTGSRVLSVLLGRNHLPSLLLPRATGTTPGAVVGVRDLEGGGEREREGREREGGEREGGRRGGEKRQLVKGSEGVWLKDEKIARKQNNNGQQRTRCLREIWRERGGGGKKGKRERGGS